MEITIFTEGMRIDPNYEDEMYAVLKVTDEGLSECQSPLCKNKKYRWFYENIKDLLDRNRRVKQE